jgi:prepilin-type N-terminal cleavage/methylation domain-containing protein
MRFNLKIKSAFTLTELLVALGVIGLISALLLPKFFANTAVIQKRTQLRNVVSQLEKVFSEENLRGQQFNTSEQRRANLTTRVQFTQVCSIDAGNLDACLPDNAPSAEAVGGVAYLFGERDDDMIIYGLLSNNADPEQNQFWIDINGNRGPNRTPSCANLNGADRFRFNLNSVTGEITGLDCADDFLAQ